MLTRPSKGERCQPPVNKVLNECKVCHILGPDELDQVEVAWLGGADALKLARVWHARLRGVKGEVADLEITPEDLVLVRDGTVDAIDHHIRVCLFTRHRSRYARVSEAFDALYRALDVAHRAYMAEPTRSNALSYQALGGELRALLTDLDKVQNAAELADDLVAWALNPLIQSLTQTIIRELGSVKEELTHHMHADDADRILKGTVERIGPLFKAATVTARDKCVEVLSAKDKNRAGAMGSPAGKSQNKRGNLRAVK